MDRIAVVANPVASQFTGGDHRDVMANLAREHQVEAIWPSSAVEATEAAAKAAADGIPIVVAMGGDGMVHHVSQGLVGTEASLGVIPAGTTNVVARLLGIPTRPIKAARLIAHAKSPMRLGTARMELIRGTTETVHHAVFACGLGLDAEVVVRADSDPYRKYRFGSIHYARTAFGVGLKSWPSRHNNLEISADDRVAEATTALVQFRSVYTYFGKVPLRLGPEPPDPMTVLVLGRLRRHRIPQIVGDVMTGRDLSAVTDMDVWPRVREVMVNAEPAVAAQADGEALGMVDGARIRWVPDSLRVIGAQSAL
jgi:diacylglycerol kinase family enzyme